MKVRSGRSNKKLSRAQEDIQQQIKDKKIKISQKLKRIIDTVLDKKCENIVVIDLRKFNHIADFFVICESGSSTQTEAVVYEFKKLSKSLKSMNIRNIEFRANAGWNVVDFGDIILHIFDRESRRFYDLEGLWIDAKKFYVEPDGSIRLQEV
ncbi:MAG: ribosome silencing factor [Candidatus Calescibacterium sp.]|nr:ribosome silencing factor [Candidatus Calescibacterium sp.]MDW8087877.1 ribosome silencing factor [Candidatus Calescibacterium sp.]